jgi:hypothetical protein
MPARNTFRRRIVLISVTAAAIPTAATAVAVWRAPTDEADGAELAKLSAIGEAFGTVSAALSAVERP